jgi:hypothetical protein
MMESEYKTMQYALFPRAFHYVTEKNVKMTTQGIALQIMKNDDVPIAKYQEDLVRKWQKLDEDSGNPLASQYLVPPWKRSHVQYLSSTKPVPTQYKNTASSQSQ